MPTAPTLRDQQTDRMLRQMFTLNRGDPVDIAGPNPALYGIYNQAYGNTLATRAQDPYFGGSEAALANLEALNETRRYESELARTREAQLQAQETAGYYGLQQAALDKSPEGLVGTYGVFTDPSGRSSIQIDPVLQAAQNAMELDAQAAENYNKRATGYKAGAEAGMVTTPEQYGLFTRNPLENPADAVTYQPGMTPSDATAAYSADEGMTVGEQFSLQELKNMGALDAAMANRDGKWKVVVNPDDGTQSFQFSGTPEELVAQGFTPPGYRPQPQGDAARLAEIFGRNPNADAQAPGASATQGSVRNFYAKPTSRRGMRTDPITHTQRMHNGDDFAYPAGTGFPAEQDGTVVSVGPMRGFGPNTVVVRYDDGSEVLYGHGRRANVQPGQRVRAGQQLGEVGSEGRSTGPHVHRQVRRQASQRTAAARPETRLSVITGIMRRAQERGMTVQQDGDTVVITSSDGRTSRRYNAQGQVVQ